MSFMSPNQEYGLQRYREIELQMERIERELNNLEENGKPTSSLVAEYNSKVDLLSRIVEQYGL